MSQDTDIDLWLDEDTDRIDELLPDGWPERPTWIVAVRTNDGKRIVFGRDDVGEFLIERARAAVLKTDLSDGARFPEPDYGLRTACGWLRYKFDIEPATDNQPYFFNFFRWGILGEILELRGQGGLPLLEAAYLRTPIVATNSGGIPEVLGGYYPYLVKAGDVQALARAIDEALFNPTDTERQVRLLKRRVLARFTWQRAYGEYLPLWVGTTQ